MSIKRIMTAALLALTTLVGAQADGIRIEPFTLAANEVKDVEILFDNATNYGGLQFDLLLPEGVSIVENDDNELCEQNTDRLSYKDFTVNANQQEDGSYRFLIYNTKGKNIAGTSGNPILTIRLTANDRVQSSTQQVRVQGQVLSTVDAEETQVPNSSFPFSLTVKTTISAVGYATFSWPVDLDFTGLEVKAYVATECKNGSIHLEQVEKVPAGTGLMLKGEQGTYTLQTTYEECEPITANLLTGTAYGEIIVSGNDTFVLSAPEGKVGLYPAKEGLKIYQYKSYLQTNSEARSLFFDDDTAGIEEARSSVNTTPAAVYTLQGVQISTPSRSGLYIKGGKIMVVKQK